MHCHPGKQICEPSQICPGIHTAGIMGGGSGVGIRPGVHCQPAAHIWPASQMLPGMQIGEVGPVRGEPPGEPPGGSAVHPMSKKARGHRRMRIPDKRERHQTPAMLNAA
jgi:hypothetical protein